MEACLSCYTQQQNVCFIGYCICNSENRIKKNRIHNCVFASPQFTETRMIAGVDPLLPLLCFRGNVCVCVYLWANRPRLVAGS